MSVTFNGNPLTLKGTQLREGDLFPDFTLTDSALTPIHGSELHGLRVFLSVPSLDTEVCDLEVKTFNQKAAELPNVSIYAVSLDLPFAQNRWCAAAGINAVKTASDYRDRSFGLATGTYIEELALLTRAVFVVTTDNKVAYAEYVPEVTNPPAYERIYQKLCELAK